MYLAAQYIQNKHCEYGINAFLYEHRKDVKITSHWWQIGTKPGELVSAKCELNPGGNICLSTLDIIAQDTESKVEIELALNKTLLDLKNKKTCPPLVKGYGQIGICFTSTNQIIRDNQICNIFEKYIEAVIELLEYRPKPPWYSHEPLVVSVCHEGSNAVYSLDKASADRIRKRHGENKQIPASVSYALNDQMDLQQLTGNLHLTMLEALTDLPPSELSGMGGVQMVSGGNKDHVLYCWPPRSGVKSNGKTRIPGR